MIFTFLSLFFILKNFNCQSNHTHENLTQYYTYNGTSLQVVVYPEESVEIKFEEPGLNQILGDGTLLFQHKKKECILIEILDGHSFVKSPAHNFLNVTNKKMILSKLPEQFNDSNIVFLPRSFFRIFKNYVNIAQFRLNDAPQTFLIKKSPAIQDTEKRKYSFEVKILLGLIGLVLLIGLELIITFRILIAMFSLKSKTQSK